MEDKRRDLQNLMALLPLARTAMGKEDARALQDYHKYLVKELEKMTPWVTKRRSDLKNLRKTVKSGTVVAIPDASDGANNPIYKDADIRKDT